MRPPIPIPPFWEAICSSCSKGPVTWIVTISYDAPHDPRNEQGKRGPGRLVWRCDVCVERDLEHCKVGLLLPVSVVAADPDAVMAALYLSGGTGSDVDTVAEALSLAGPWVEIARAHLLAQPPPQD